MGSNDKSSSRHCPVTRSLHRPCRLPPPCWAGAALCVVHPGVPFDQEDAGISEDGLIRGLGVDGNVRPRAVTINCRTAPPGANLASWAAGPPALSARAAVQDRLLKVVLLVPSTNPKLAVTPLACIVGLAPPPASWRRRPNRRPDPPRTAHCVKWLPSWRHRPQAREPEDHSDCETRYYCRGALCPARTDAD